MEILDGKAMQFLQFLSALQGGFHPSAGEAHEKEVEPSILAPTPHGSTEDVAPVEEEDATPVEEEEIPFGDPSPDATSMDAWPHYNPTTGHAQVSLLFFSIGRKYNFYFSTYMP
jgi:hypothetical protein